MRLVGSIATPPELTAASRERMFALMERHFDGVTRANFDRDLAEKGWVVVLRDRESGEIQGFSTLMLVEGMVEGESVRAIFSGDTIVHRDYWGEPALAAVWGSFVLELAHQLGGRLYWFLISKGYRTYRFLPLYFSTFYPRHDARTPAFEQAALSALARAKFGARYDERRGLVVAAGAPGDRLAPELAVVSSGRRVDPHVEFFLSANPGYADGDELVCLAPLAYENLRPVARRICQRAEAASAPGS